MKMKNFIMLHNIITTSLDRTFYDVLKGKSLETFKEKVLNLKALFDSTRQSQCLHSTRIHN